MPTARGWLSTCAVDNHIYALGGALDIGSNLDAVEAFDPLTNTWTTKTPMPTPRGCAAACAVRWNYLCVWRRVVYCSFNRGSI